VPHSWRRECKQSNNVIVQTDSIGSIFVDLSNRLTFELEYVAFVGDNDPSSRD